MTDVQETNDPARETSSGMPATRRGLLVGASAAGTTVLLAACGSADPAPAPAPSAPAAGSGVGSPGNGSTTVLAATAEVPVGGGVIKDNVVITQPTAGQFRAFDRKCTHAGCPVSKVTTTIDCTCHNSSFSLEDGAPQPGAKATTPLTAIPVKVDGAGIVPA